MHVYIQICWSQRPRNSSPAVMSTIHQIPFIFYIHYIQNIKLLKPAMHLGSVSNWTPCIWLVSEKGLGRRPEDLPPTLKLWYFQVTHTQESMVMLLLRIYVVENILGKAPIQYFFLFPFSVSFWTVHHTHTHTPIRYNKICSHTTEPTTIMYFNWIF